MKPNFKKVLAGVSILAITTIQSALASGVTFTGSVTGGATNTNVEWDGTIPGTATGSATVTVSATVVPTLSMNLSKSSLDFGELTPGTALDQSLDITTTTNAKWGITVSVGSSGLATGDTANDTYIGTLGRDAAVQTTPNDDSYTITSSTTSGGTALTAQNVAATQNVLTASNVAQSNATTTITLSALSQAKTEAGNYNDTLTFTVTGSF